MTVPQVQVATGHFPFQTALLKELTISSTNLKFRPSGPKDYGNLLTGRMQELSFPSRLPGEGFTFYKTC
jgi:hypothetical protein